MLKNPPKTIQTIATLKSLDLTRNVKKVLYADLIITYSDFSKAKLEQAGLDNVKRIYPGIDLNHYQATTYDKDFAKSLDVKASDFVVTYPGEYVRLGATDSLVKSLPELVKKMPNLKFIFGCRIKNKADSQKKSAVQHKIKQMGLEKSVIYTDTVTSMVDLYNLSDVVVFPVQNMHGKFDVPLAVIEAMACAKPVIVSDLPVLKEFTSQDNSIVVPAANETELINQLHSLYKNPAKIKRVGGKAREYAETNFNIEVVAREYASAYNEVSVGSRQ